MKSGSRQAEPVTLRPWVLPVCRYPFPNGKDLRADPLTPAVDYPERVELQARVSRDCSFVCRWAGPGRAADRTKSYPAREVAVGRGDFLLPSPRKLVTRHSKPSALTRAVPAYETSAQKNYLCSLDTRFPTNRRSEYIGDVWNRDKQLATREQR